jgi:archaellum component FlaC
MNGELKDAINNLEHNNTPPDFIEATLQAMGERIEELENEVKKLRTPSNL